MQSKHTNPRDALLDQTSPETRIRKRKVSNPIHDPKPTASIDPEASPQEAARTPEPTKT